jgi:tRNA-uridine 2-sulfurtransferase
MDLTPDTVVVALSGGVDSSTALALLHEAGHRVVGITLRLYDARGSESSSGGRCCGPRDIEDARAVCAHLGVPFYVVDLEREFTEAVVDDFVSEYAAGRTPNPCVKCNEKIKFGPLLRRARALGAAKLATGHYARLEAGRLYRAADADKDQSYFLFAMPGRDRREVLFPLGGMKKDEVRAHARRLGLPNADKGESQEICFVPDGDYASFVAARVGDAPGEIIDTTGTVVGRHDGIHRYTVGQRRGLGVAAAEPLYVIAVDSLTRRVKVGPRAALSQTQLTVRDVRWATDATDLRAAVQVRHRGKTHPATIRRAGPDAEVLFDTPLEGAAAAGQAAVFYDGDEVLGGGWIG